jgi:chemotaxis protein MotA
MDISTFIGVVLGILSLVIGFMLEGGGIGSLYQETAAIIVFGGTAGAVITGTPMKVLKKVPYILKMAFIQQNVKLHETIEELVELSNKSRREGLLSIEKELEKYQDDPFLYEGLQMVVDGVEAELIQDILDREIDLYEQSHMKTAGTFEAAGGFAPTMGIIGTVMGLVHVLGNLSDPESLGPAIAVAFIATLYGVASANVIYLPLFNKIKARVAQGVMIKELQSEGIQSIQHGENPGILQKKLFAFLDSKTKRKNDSKMKENEAV